MITVKDIREKEFSQQKRGYNEDEVDEFLDEIADQLETLIRENRGLIKKLDEAQAALDAHEYEQASAPAPQNPVAQAPESAMRDDSSYFRNLEATLRETLLSAQRIADKTVSEAKEKADKTLEEANAKAEEIKRSAMSETESLRSTLAQDTQEAQVKLDGLKIAISSHKKQFRDLLKAQLDALGEDEE